MFNRLRIFLGGCDHRWVDKQTINIYRSGNLRGYEYHRQCTVCRVVRGKRIEL